MDSCPRMACSPLAQITMTMPMFTKTVNAGDMVGMNRITLTEWSVKSSLAASKRSPSKSARTKALTRRAPAMFSCRTVLSLSSFCCTDRKSGSILTMKKTMTPEVTSRSGSMVSARLDDDGLVMLGNLEWPYAPGSQEHCGSATCRRLEPLASLRRLLWPEW